MSMRYRGLRFEDSPLTARDAFNIYCHKLPHMTFSDESQTIGVRGGPQPLVTPQRDFISVGVLKMGKSPLGILFNLDWRQSSLTNFRDIAVVIVNSKYDRHTRRASLRGIVTFWVNSEEKWPCGCFEGPIKATTYLVSFYTDFGIPIS